VVCSGGKLWTAPPAEEHLIKKKKLRGTMWKKTNFHPQCKQGKRRMYFGPRELTVVGSRKSEVPWSDVLRERFQAGGGCGCEWREGRAGPNSQEMDGGGKEKMGLTVVQDGGGVVRA